MWRNGRRTGLKNLFRAISAGCAALLAVRVLTFIYPLNFRFSVFFPVAVEVVIPRVKLAQNLAQIG